MNNTLKVEVVDTARHARRGWLHCQEGLHLSFDTARLESYCLAEWEPIIYDALLLTAAIEFCDRIKRRPTMTWGRHIQLRLPVHDTAHWHNKNVHDSLHAAIEQLTGDKWDILFYQRTKKITKLTQSRLYLPTGNLSILPYSDGLDSRSVAGLMAKDIGENLIRVRLNNKAIKAPKRLGLKQPFTSVPYKVSSGNHRFVETSARSRGFKFAMLGGIAAYLAKAQNIIVPESGQGALGPVLVVSGQSYEDYRNHPVFTRRMEKLLLALFSHNIQFKFPRLWHTKGETLKEYAAIKGSIWADTRSCWQQSRQVSINGSRLQCGICAACMLRRLSVHAAGLSEPNSAYVWGDLSAPNFENAITPGFTKLTKAQRQYAVAGTLHLDHLAGLYNSTVHGMQLKMNAVYLAEALGIPEHEASTKLSRLLQQHANEWKNFIGSIGTQSFIADWAINI